MAKVGEFVPVKGTFVRRTGMSVAFAKAGLVETHPRGFLLEPTTVTPCKKKKQV